MPYKYNQAFIYIVTIIFIVTQCGCIGNYEPPAKEGANGMASISNDSIKDGFIPLLSQMGSTILYASGSCIKQTTNGDYIICGHGEDVNGGKFIFLLKMDAARHMIFAKKFSECDIFHNNDWRSCFFLPHSMQLNPDGGYTIYALRDFAEENRRELIIKLDKDGNMIEKKVVLDMPDLFSFDETKDGGFILSGVDKKDSHSIKPALIIKIDFDSNIEWTRTFKASGDAFGESVKQTSDNGYIIKCSISNSSDEKYDPKGWLIKTDSNGNKLWDRIFWRFLYDVLQTSDKDFVISGTDGDSLHLAKIDENGNLIWERTFLEGLAGQFNSIHETPEGDYIIAGHVFNQATSQDADGVVIKINSMGKKIWQKVFGGIGYNSVFDIQSTIDGGYILTGLSSNNNSHDILLIKIDSIGNEEWGYYHHPK